MLAQRVKKNALNTIVVPTVMSRVAGKNYKEELVAMAMGVGEFYLRCIP